MKTIGKICTFIFGALFGAVGIATIYMSNDDVSDTWEATKRASRNKYNYNTK